MIKSKQIEQLYYQIKDTYNLSGISYGYKIKNKSRTKEKGLIYFVSQKKPLHQLKSEEIIPKSIIIDGTSYITDVLEAPEIIGLQTSNCGTIDSSSDPHRSLVRPLKGGISISGGGSATGQILPLGAYAGTLGGIVVDKEDGSICFLTNNHVVVVDAFLNSDKDPDTIFNYNIRDRRTVQPGSLDNNGLAADKDYIGLIKRYYPLEVNEINYVDVALISVDARFVNINESFKFLGIENPAPLPFASTQEIDSILDNNITLYKSGRTTGLNSTDTPPCRLSAFATGILSVGGYKMQGYTGADAKVVDFAESILVAYEDFRSFPGAPGDSGSFVIGDFNGILKIVGILFAGDSAFLQWFAFNRIDRVQELLNIDAWRGDSWQFSDSKQWNYLLKPGLSSNITIVEDNKKYWQIGVDASVLNDVVTLNSLYVNYDPAKSINSCFEYDSCSGKPLGYNSNLNCDS
jgi:hypothetical protein